MFRLTFALQSAQDPSLTVDAGTVWRDPTALRRWLDDPAELLLGELGRAARVYPEIADALRTPRPTGMDLDLAGAPPLPRPRRRRPRPRRLRGPAARGLARRAGAPRARRRGAGRGPRGRRRHQRPAAPRRPRRLLLAPRGRRRGPARTTRWTPSCARRRRWCACAGRWVAVDPDRLRDGLEFLAERRANGDHPSVGDVLHLARHAPRRRAPRRCPWRSCASTARSATSSPGGSSLEPLDDPPGVHATLRPYQRRGLSWLAFLARLGPRRRARRRHGPGQDAAGPGAGEPRARRRTTQPGPTLLVCPTSVVATWRREAERFVPDLRVAVHHGAGRTDPARRARLAGRRPRRHLVRHAGPRLPRPSPGSPGTASCSTRPRWSRTTARARAKAVRRLDAEHRLALTGTPVENRLAELWSIMDAVNPGMLGTAERLPRALRRPRRAPRPHRRRRATCAGAPARSCCAGSRPTRRSSTTCRTRSRPSSAAG